MIANVAFPQREVAAKLEQCLTCMHAYRSLRPDDARDEIHPPSSDECSKLGGHAGECTPRVQRAVRLPIGDSAFDAFQSADAGLEESGCLFRRDAP